VPRLKLSGAFSLQLDESRDVSGLAVVHMLIRYLFKKESEEAFVQCSHFFRYLICKMLNFQGMRQRNQNIVRLDIAPDTRI